MSRHSLSKSLFRDHRLYIKMDGASNFGAKTNMFTAWYKNGFGLFYCIPPPLHDNWARVIFFNSPDASATSHIWAFFPEADSNHCLHLTGQKCMILSQTTDPDDMVRSAVNSLTDCQRASVLQCFSVSSILLRAFKMSIWCSCISRCWLCCLT